MSADQYPFDEAAILEMLPRVGYLARRAGRRLPRCVETDDLFQYGVLGLLKAMKSYKPARGVGFMTYAWHCIRSSIMDGLVEMSPLTAHVSRRVRRYRTAESSLAQTLGRKPTADEVCTAMGVSPVVRQALLHEIYAAWPMSIDDAQTGNNPALCVSPEVTKRLNQGDDAQSVSQALQGLDYRHRLVVFLYYYEEKTQQEIASTLGVSESRICQIHRQSLRQLRGLLAEQGITGRE